MMVYNGTQRARLFKYLLITLTVLSIGLMKAAGLLAQWPPYSTGLSIGSLGSGLSFDSPFLSFSPVYSNPFTLALSFPPALSSFSGSGTRGGESYGNSFVSLGNYGQFGQNSQYIQYSPISQYNNTSILSLFPYSSYGNSNPSSLFSSLIGPAYSGSNGRFSSGLSGGLYGGSNGGLYAGVTSYYSIFPSGTPFLFPQPYSSASAYMGSGAISSLGPLQPGTIGSPIVTVTSNTRWNEVPSIIPVQYPQTVTKPAPAPVKMEGEWQSRQITNANTGAAAAGSLALDTSSEPGILEIASSPLPLGSGPVTQFQYIPTSGDAPISFMAEFPSGYTAVFTGTANNSLCPLNVYCAFAGIFTVKGEYVIKDDRGQAADQGTFNLEGPVRTYKPRPKPVAAIQVLGNPNGGDILSLTTGPDGRIYGGTNNGSEREGCMFVYDPVTGELTELGKPGYECASMVTANDDLIYIGGGSKYISDYNTMGYANLAVYDPQKAWNPGRGLDANPRDLGQVVSYPEDTRAIPIEVRDLVADRDGRIYGCTGWRNVGPRDYYAHLFVYDPRTEKIEYLGQPIPHQGSINSLTMASDGLLYGVVQPAPASTYKRPEGKIFAYDPFAKSFSIIDPKPVDEGVLALTIGHDGLIYAAGTADMNRIFSYDPASCIFDSKGTLGGCAEVLDMICTENGLIYMGSAVNGYLIRYDPTKPWTDRPWDESQDKPGVNPRLFHWTGKVGALTEGLDGYIYFGTLDGNLLVYTGEE
ncbi:MAG: hypothetical protein AB1847_02035 [bacterium]